MDKLRTLSLKQVIDIYDEEGKVVVAQLEVDFSDKRFTNKVLHLMKRYNNIENELKEKLAGLDELEDAIDKAILYSDVELELLEDFKKNVDNVFNTNVTEKMFGDCAPDIIRYYPFFERLFPYLQRAKLIENNAMQAIIDKYGIDRIVDKEEAQA